MHTVFRCVASWNREVPLGTRKLDFARKLSLAATLLPRLNNLLYPTYFDRAPAR